MVYNKDKWLAAYKKAVADLKTDKPTGGLPCAVASIRYMRDSLIDDLGEAHDAVPDIKESFGELLKAITSAGSVDEGFLSNASAAAKAAGFKSTAEKLAELVE